MECFKSTVFMQDVEEKNLELLKSHPFLVHLGMYKYI